jgi:hypothetical protein
MLVVIDHTHAPLHSGSGEQTVWNWYFQLQVLPPLRVEVRRRFGLCRIKHHLPTGEHIHHQLALLD